MDRPKPPWLRVAVPGGARYHRVRRAVADHGLHTVCAEARCPNTAECWGSGTATFLVLGDRCTRGCRFCAVGRGPAGGPPDPDEPARVARSSARMGLDYVVVTSVTRDDLPDGGASVFGETIRRLRDLPNRPRVEVLTPDYTGDALETVLAAGPDVFAHNLEVVERLTPRLRHPRFSYRRSLAVLAEATGRGALTKSSLMLGVGERRDEVLAAMADLRDAGVEILVLGQYLQPTRDHAPVARYLPPDAFDDLAAAGRELGFGYVAAGPLVRTSYRAAEAYVARRLGDRSPGDVSCARSG